MEPTGQLFVEHVVLAQIAVRQHVVAKLLGLSQPGAVTEHQPRMRPQHRHVIGDVARVRWPGSDVDHGDTGAVRLHQVISRHLREALRRAAGDVRAAEAGVAHDDVARRNERIVGRVAVRHVLAADLCECVDIELIVGEDHEVLEVLRVGAGVVVEPVQRIIDARAAKQRERRRRPGWHLMRAVGDGIVHCGEVGRVEYVAQRPFHRRPAAHRATGGDVDVARIGEVNRDRLVGFADFDRGSVVLDQQADLVDQIARERGRAGSRSCRRRPARPRTRTRGASRRAHRC